MSTTEYPVASTFERFGDYGSGVIMVGDRLKHSADENFAKSVNLTLDELKFAISKLQEVNPVRRNSLHFFRILHAYYSTNCISATQQMLGFRGCRLGVVYPELTKMQARAITEAFVNCKKRGLNPQCEIMIPLICDKTEFLDQKMIIDTVIADVKREQKLDLQFGLGLGFDIKIGTMIEVPRAALASESIANAGAQFFSYGTNDLTQLTFGFSR